MSLTTFFLRPDLIAPTTGTCTGYSSLHGRRSLVVITEDEIAPLMLSGSWIGAEAVLAVGSRQQRVMRGLTRTQSPLRPIR